MKSRSSRFPSRQVLILFLLACLIALTFERSVQAANWLSDRSNLLTAAFLGIFFGLLLSFSRFRGSTALAYHALLSVLYAADSIGHFLPSAALQRTASNESILWIIHVRLMVTIEIITGWLQTLLSKHPIQEQKWVLFCLTLMIWNLLAWMIWWIFRKRRALVGMVPIGAVFAVNVHLSDQSNYSLFLFVMLSVLVVVSCEYWRRHLDWESRRVDHPDVVFEWTTTSIALSFAITFLAFVFPLFASTQGLRSISDFLKRIRIEPQTSVTRDSQTGARSEARSLKGARTPDVSVIGTPIDQGSETIMLVRISDPPPPPIEPAESFSPTTQHYWRSGMFGTYTGRGWEPVQFTEHSTELSLPTNPPAGRYILDQQFQILVTHDETLFAVNLPIVGSENVQIIPIGSKDAILIGSTEAYSVTSWATQLSIEELTSANLEPPSEILTVYLQLPDSLPLRVSNLAARITAGAETAYDKAEKIEKYLRGQYTYTLDVPPVPNGSDAVDYFLFDAPGGFCSYYASAMAVMLRTQGVPARVVTGYAMGVYDESEAAYRVLARDAHAWVEVYFPEFGWVEFEPTAARSIFQRSAEAIESPATSPAVDTPPAIILDRQTLRTVVVILILASASWAAFHISRRIDLTPKTPRHNAQSLYRGVRRALRNAGYAAQSSTTPNEFLERFSISMIEAPKVLAALTQSTSLFLKARYSNLEVGLEESQAVRALWRRALPQFLSLWLHNTILNPTRSLIHRIRQSTKV